MAHVMQTITPGEFEVLNSGGAIAGAASIYNVGPNPVALIPKTSASALTALESEVFITLRPGDAIINQTLAQLFPGLAATHLHAHNSSGSPTRLAVSCA